MNLGVNKNLMIDEASPTIDVNVRTTLKLLQPEALERCLFMAHNELQVVGELNAEAIRKISDRYLQMDSILFKYYLSHDLKI